MEQPDSPTFHIQDYVTARTYLRKAADTAAGKENPQYAYELATRGLARETTGNRKEGFIYLANAVKSHTGAHLRGGADLAGSRQNRYRQAGGTDKDWSRYLVATASTGRSAATATADPRPSPRPARLRQKVAGNQAPSSPPAQIARKFRPREREYAAFRLLLPSTNTFSEEQGRSSPFASAASSPRRLHRSRLARPGCAGLDRNLVGSIHQQ